jgi:hypothetical protein
MHRSASGVYLWGRMGGGAFDGVRNRIVLLHTACVLVLLLPLSIFRATRKFACLGLYVAAIIFGASIWLTGFLVTWTYFGGLGVFIGLVTGLVGIVPLGIVAAMINADWSAVSFLLLGLGLTFGVRMLAIWLGSLVDRASYEAA